MGILDRLFKSAPAKPLLSLVVVVYRMPAQAEKTLHSLSCAYQQGVDETDYEVIVVENSSDEPLGGATAEKHGDNFRYFYREESRATPVPAAHFGVEQSRAELLGLVIDGARMATPGLVRQVIDASRTHANPVIAVPGYHLGDEVQQSAMLSGYNEQKEARLLESIGWPREGYRLFDIACFSRSSGAGFFLPNGESNCLCMRRTLWDDSGGLDPQFTEAGGGMANPDLYKRLCEEPSTGLVMLPGDGGVTTGTPPEVREQHMKNYTAQYEALRGSPFRPPATRPVLYGGIPDNALRFMQYSVERALESAPARPGAAG
jgi:hypothetical protein